jgi:ribonucleoside-diphosphate reductase alpha chain
MDYSENALAVYKKLYFRENESLPEEVHKRVSSFASNGDFELKGKIKYYLDNQFFRFGSPTMMNAGFMKNPQTSSCFVGELSDDLISIFDFDRTCGIVYKDGSGIGINYGRLRETNAALSKGGFSSGPFSFIRKSASTCWAVKSGGTSRRAAFMCMFFDDHPDLIEFISFKDDHKSEIIILPDGSIEELFSCMNFSVALSNTFMKAVKEDLDWYLIGVVDRKIKKTIKAKEIFKLIAKYAHKCGDPGIGFIDRVNEDNTLLSIGNYSECNPCGEQYLHPNGCCALASINLEKCISKEGIVDFILLKDLVHTITESLDNMVDISSYPTPKFKEMAINTRNLGIGIMGTADFLIKLRIPYNSKEAQILMKNISKYITQQVIIKSSLLAEEKGTFNLYNENKEATLNVAKKFFDHTDHKELDQIDIHGLRNSNWTTCAPTGTSGISCDCSYGIEPLFALCYNKKISDSTDNWTFTNKQFEEAMNNIPKPKRLLKNIYKDIANNKGSCQGIDGVPEDIQEIFITAHDISWKDRIQMQAHIQQNISNSISSTINLPNETTVEEIEQIYEYAFDMKLKGITVYRDGCKENQPISFGQKECKEFIVEKPTLMQRPIKRIGETCELNTPHGRLFITGNKDEDGKLFETFLRIGKQGSLNNLLIDALSRCISKSLQSGLTLDVFTDTLRGNKEIPFRFKLDENQEEPFYAESLVDAVGIVFQEIFLKEKTRNEKSEILKLCPNCGKWGVDPSGCSRGGVCLFCSFSNCM